MGTAGSAGGGKVSPLRRRMIQDMELAGLTVGTQKVYIGAVLDLVKHYGGKRPELMSEDEVYRYLLWLREERKVGRGTFQTRFGGLKFFFYRTLDRNWSLFFKEESPAIVAEAFAAGALEGGVSPADRGD